jgi:hypothetical protein
MRKPIEIEIARMQRGITKREMAKAMRMEESLLGRKLRGRTCWQDGEYERACELVGLEPFHDRFVEEEDNPCVASAGKSGYTPTRTAYMGPLRHVQVDGHSMIPTLEHGWTVAVRRCEWGSVKPGDIVLVTWAQHEESAFYEAYPRPDGSLRLMKRNILHAKDEREMLPEQVLEMTASVSLVTGVVHKGAKP